MYIINNKHIVRRIADYRRLECHIWRSARYPKNATDIEIRKEKGKIEVKNMKKEEKTGRNAEKTGRKKRKNR